MENKATNSRNTPCENCREQRRKCKKVKGQSSCERCQAMNLTCIIRLIEKPKIIYKRMAPLPKRIKLMSTIEHMSRELEGMVLELDKITEHQQKEEEEEECQCEEAVPCKHMALLPQNTKWACSFTQKNGSLTFQASIHSFSELKQFLTETMQAFQASPSSATLSHHHHCHHNYSTTTLPFLLQQSNLNNNNNNNNHNNNNNSNNNNNNNHIVIHLTFRNFKDQAIFFRLLKMDRAPLQHVDQKTLDFDDPEYIDAKQKILSVYFDCLHKITPILIRSYYYPYLKINPSSLLATSIITAATLSTCHHIQQLQINMKQISETALQETQTLLNENLFSIVDLDTCISLFYLGTSEIYSLCSQKAKVYSNLCWRMLQELKNQYTGVLTDPNEQIKAETWKRLYYFAFYLEANLCNVHNISTHYAVLKDPLFPKEMPCEKEQASSILCMHFIAKIFVTTCHHDLIWFKLTTGNLDRVPIATIHQLEHTLYQLWLEIPPELQIGNGPLEYITPLTSRAAWSDPAVLRLNQIYYTFWLTVHIRFMTLEKPTSSSFGDRALMIASICSDTLTKLFYYMNQHCACAIDTYWLVLLNEVLDILHTCPQPEIRQRARWNRSILKQVMDVVLRRVSSAPFFEISHYELCTLYNKKQSWH